MTLEQARNNAKTLSKGTDRSIYVYQIDRDGRKDYGTCLGINDERSRMEIIAEYYDGKLE